MAFLDIVRGNRVSLVWFIFLFVRPNARLLYTPTGLSDSPVHSLVLSPALAVSLHTGRFAWRWCTRVLLEKSPCTWTTRGHTAAFRFSARRFWLGLSNEESPFTIQWIALRSIHRIVSSPNTEHLAFQTRPYGFRSFGYRTGEHR